MALSENEIQQAVDAIRTGMSSPEKHLKEWQKTILKKMVAMGMNPHEAKLRALTIGSPRDIDERVPYSFEEFPKMVYHQSGMTKVVNNDAEHVELGDAWTTQPTVVKLSWRDKASEVYTKYGIKIEEYHVAFLKEEGVEGIKTLADAAVFIDNLTQDQQEEFLLEATKWNLSVDAPDAVEETEADVKATKKGKGKSA